MPAVSIRPDLLVVLADANWTTFVPALTTASNAFAGGFRLRRFIGGQVYNRNAGAITFELRWNDGVTNPELMRVTLAAQYYRYIFREEDFRNLPVGIGLDIQLTAIPGTSVVAVARSLES
jgi:hypothetical protein